MPAVVTQSSVLLCYFAERLFFYVLALAPLSFPGFEWTGIANVALYQCGSYLQARILNSYNTGEHKHALFLHGVPVTQLFQIVTLFNVILPSPVFLLPIAFVMGLATPEHLTTQCLSIIFSNGLLDSSIVAALVASFLASRPFINASLRAQLVTSVTFTLLAFLYGRLLCLAPSGWVYERLDQSSSDVKIQIHTSVSDYFFSALNRDLLLFTPLIVLLHYQNSCLECTADGVVYFIAIALTVLLVIMMGMTLKNGGYRCLSNRPFLILPVSLVTGLLFFVADIIAPDLVLFLLSIHPFIVLLCCDTIFHLGKREVPDIMAYAPRYPRIPDSIAFQLGSSCALLALVYTHMSNVASPFFVIVVVNTINLHVRDS